jgi:hypothetical protein
MPGYELGNRGIELSQVFGIGSSRIMASKELGCKKKTLCVFEVGINWYYAPTRISWSTCFSGWCPPE